MERHRCHWAERGSPELQVYHDQEWGKPLHSDPELFELLILETFHCGLSWQVVLNKREAFRAAMDYFDVQKIARYDWQKIEELLINPGLIRHRGKLEAAVINARCFLEIQQAFGSFDDYLNHFTCSKRIRLHEIPHPSVTPLSDAVARDLKKRGMKFVGSVTIEAYLEAAGYIDAHEPCCFCAQ